MTMYTDTIMDNIKYFTLLSRDYPNVQRAAAEIISLEARLKLPKSTEMYMSDIHGEHEAFSHILNNASGVIREKIDVALAGRTTPEENAVLATLIYYPVQKLDEIKQSNVDMNEWYKTAIYRLIDVCRHVASKNTRQWVRQAIPEGYEFIIDELLHAHFEDHNKEFYYNQFVTAIIENKTADDFIAAISTVIKRLAVHRLHIVGDIFDRGERPDIIIDKLMEHHAVDIQWGNHDVLWMCGGTGNPLGVVSVVRICATYNNLDVLETGYGINLRPLAIFAEKHYNDCPVFMPRGANPEDEDAKLVAKMHKAISIIMYKLQCQVIRRNPCFYMEDRCHLLHIDYENGTLELGGEKHPLLDCDFPTIDPKDPAKLTKEEQAVVNKLCRSFIECEKLQEHIRFLYAKGAAYRVENGMLMFHGAIPLNEDGSFREIFFGGKGYKGKALMDFCDKMARVAYFGEDGTYEKQLGQDLLWYLWCGKNSPMFGRSNMTTFEHAFLENPLLSIEHKDPYYIHWENPDIAEKILAEFGLYGPMARIINGHVPVKSKKGESPLKANGKIIVIDGGFCHAYHSKTGIAGYTMVYSSRGLSLRVHEPFESVEKVIKENSDIRNKVDVFETMKKRMLVEDTDEGKYVKTVIGDLKLLIQAYQLGIIKEKRS
ncbi:MAG: fructose-1,6-bisphosphatase [Oscillospiraceae bacterium]|nr:fructose-1,6-bisphosphatase [Oscillospiraceae bacterium]